MYVRNLRIKHLKLLRDFDLSFLNSDGTPRMWTVLIGENGTGKTSILQAIALAAAGSLQVNTLGEAVVDVLRDRRKNEAMQIEVNFGFSEAYHSTRPYPGITPGRARPPQPPHLLSQVNLAAPPKGRRGVRVERTSLRATSQYLGPGWETPSSADPLTDARDLQAPHWFVAGYGVARSLPDHTAQVTLRNPSVDRLRPLFPKGGLVGTGFMSHFQREPAKARLFMKVLQDALFTDVQLLPAIRNLELRGHGGVGSAADFLEGNRFGQAVGQGTMKVPALSLSHGYQSTIAWIADLIGHIILEANNSIQPNQMEGVVLIDELDLYLHPRWQVTLITALRNTFPRLQFIVSTHSPATLAGLRTDRDEIVRLGNHPETGDVRVINVRDTGARDEPDPRFMTGSDLYERYFGMPEATIHPLGGLLRDYVALASNPYRDDGEDAQMQAMRERLEAAGAPSLYEPTPRALP